MVCLLLFFFLCNCVFAPLSEEKIEEAKVILIGRLQEASVNYFENNSCINFLDLYANLHCLKIVKEDEFEDTLGSGLMKSSNTLFYTLNKSQRYLDDFCIFINSKKFDSENYCWYQLYIFEQILALISRIGVREPFARVKEGVYALPTKSEDKKSDSRYVKDSTSAEDLSKIFGLTTEQTNADDFKLLNSQIDRVLSSVKSPIVMIGEATLYSIEQQLNLGVYYALYDPRKIVLLPVKNDEGHWITLIICNNVVSILDSKEDKKETAKEKLDVYVAMMNSFEVAEFKTGEVYSTKKQKDRVHCGIHVIWNILLLALADSFEDGIKNCNLSFGVEFISKILQHFKNRYSIENIIKKYKDNSKLTIDDFIADFRKLLNTIYAPAPRLEK